MRSFDRSRVPAKVQELNAALLDQLETEGITKLRDAKPRWATACHEAAHGFFRLKAGAVRLKIIGPHFVYDPVASTIVTVAAAVSSEWPPPTTSWCSEDVGYWSAAGAIWEKELCPDSLDAEEGAALDKIRFAEDVRRANPKLTAEELGRVWTWVEEQVRKDLKNAEFKREILTLAKTFDRWLRRYYGNC